jgi:hypothetical protein
MGGRAFLFVLLLAGAQLGGLGQVAAAAGPHIGDTEPRGPRKRCTGDDTH